MQILCINFKTPQESSCAEAFLVLSPRVQFRFPCYVFIDLTSTLHLLGGSEACLLKSLELAKLFNPDSSAAIAPTASLAQLYAKWKPQEICGENPAASLAGLGLDALQDLEGLIPWPQKKNLEHMIGVFHSLGIHTLSDVYNFRISSLRERWGDYGALLWNRLHAQDFQVLSPLVPGDPLVAYRYLDTSLGSAPLLFAELKNQLDILFVRLQGLSRFAQKIKLTLYCEFSDKSYDLVIEPVSPNRDQGLYEDLIFKKLQNQVLQSNNLENPIQEFEITVFDVPEKAQQMDFFEPRDTQEDRWRRLISFARQADCEVGFLQIKPSHFPEQSFEFSTDWPKEFFSKDTISFEDQAVQVKSVYAKDLSESPRPSLLLKQPKPLSGREQQQLYFLSEYPIERIESSWWQNSTPQLKNRDYYFAISPSGQLLWVFKDRLNSQVYLHGYFD